MYWQVSHKSHKIDRLFESREEGQEYLSLMGSAFIKEYSIEPITDCSLTKKALVEGFAQEDLKYILLPKLSIDEYIPSGDDSDVVVSMVVKGVPEAVIPLKDFLSHNKYTNDVSYSESEFYVNSAIIYMEFNRETFNAEILEEIVDDLSLLNGVSKEDFTMSFPSSNKTYQFNTNILNQYLNAVKDLK